MARLAAHPAKRITELRPWRWAQGRERPAVAAQCTTPASAPPCQPQRWSRSLPPVAAAASMAAASAPCVNLAGIDIVAASHDRHGRSRVLGHDPPLQGNRPAWAAGAVARGRAQRFSCGVVSRWILISSTRLSTPKSVKAMTLSSSRPWTQITPSSGSISMATSKRKVDVFAEVLGNQVDGPDVGDLVDVHGSGRERCDGLRLRPPVPRQQLIEPIAGWAAMRERKALRALGDVCRLQGGDIVGRGGAGSMRRRES